LNRDDTTDSLNLKMAVSEDHDSDSVVLTPSGDLSASITNLRCGEPVIPEPVSSADDDDDALIEPLVLRRADSASTTSRNDAAADEDNQQFLVPSDDSNRQRLSANSTKDSLASATTTPIILSIFIPILACLAHALFYYGQTAPMWRLRLSQHVDAWANATTTETKVAFDTLGIPLHNSFYIQEDTDIETFTYGYAVRQLWRAKGMQGKVLPRVAAVLLTLFSGVWPHLKLILVNVTWLGSWSDPTLRTRSLRWLSALGKWSLADVLAVCVMVGVLNLDWEVDPDAIKHGVMTELPTIIEITKGNYNTAELCSLLLKYKCDRHTRMDKKIKCGACQSLVSEAYSHPSWAQGTGQEIVKGISTSGGGAMKLRVVGMRGIYAFCQAVVLSIILSLLVDVFDHKARREREKREHHTLLRETMQTRSEELEEVRTMQSMEVDSRSGVVSVAQGPTRSYRIFNFSWKYVVLVVGALLTTALVYFAITTPCMERRVDGAIPILLQKVLGVAWDHTYSLRGLVITTGAAGAWDLLLMRTFNLFVVFGPIFRSLVCVFGLTVPLPRMIRRALYMTVDFAGAFCAWEVFIIAMFMVDMLMPSITDTIYNNPACAQVSENGSCLKVEFNILNSFLLLVFGGAMLLLISGLVVTHGFEEEKQYRARLARSYSTVEIDLEHQETSSDYVRLEREEDMIENPNGGFPLGLI